MDPFSAIGFFLVASFLLLILWQLSRLEKELRLIRTLVAAFMEQRVAGTVAENRLAAAVHEASKDAAAIKR